MSWIFCVVAFGSQLVIFHPAAVVMSEIVLVGPHYVCGGKPCQRSDMLAQVKQTDNVY